MEANAPSLVRSLAHRRVRVFSEEVTCKAFLWKCPVFLTPRWAADAQPLPFQPAGRCNRSPLPQPGPACTHWRWNGAQKQWSGTQFADRHWQRYGHPVRRETHVSVLWEITRTRNHGRWWHISTSHAMHASNTAPVKWDKDLNGLKCFLK